MKTRLTDQDGEVRELADADVNCMRPMLEVLPSGLQCTVGQRGKQRSPTKVKTSIRLSQEVVDHFKEEGEGWQRLMTSP
jgi:uncharacterized protein (DUF4415 family)